MRRAQRLLVGFALTAAFCGAAVAADYRTVAGGTLDSVLPPDGKSASAQVAPFRLRRTPVTNAEFLAFVTTSPRWRRDAIAPLFADREYLSHWSGALTLGPAAEPNQPVTRVSWFAARASAKYFSTGSRVDATSGWRTLIAARREITAWTAEWTRPLGPLPS